MFNGCRWDLWWVVRSSSRGSFPWEILSNLEKRKIELCGSFCNQAGAFVRSGRANSNLAGTVLKLPVRISFSIQGRSLSILVFLTFASVHKLITVKFKFDFATLASKFDTFLLTKVHKGRFRKGRGDGCCFCHDSNKGFVDESRAAEDSTDRAVGGIFRGFILLVRIGEVVRNGAQFRANVRILPVNNFRLFKI